MEKRWITLVFLFLQISSYTSAMCQKVKSSSRIYFENSGGSACDMKQSFYFNEGYLRVNVVQIHMEPSGNVTIYGNPLVTNNTSCIIITASGSLCVKEEDLAGCERLEKKKSAADFHFVSTAAGEKVELRFSVEACQRNSESNMTEAATYSTTDAVEGIFVTNTTESETSAAPSLNSTTPSRLPEGRVGLEIPAITDGSAVRANVTSAAVQTTIVEHVTIATMPSASIVIVIAVVGLILAILAMLGFAQRRKTTKRKVSAISDGINPTSISVVSPKRTSHNVYEDDRVNVAVTSPNYRKVSPFLLPDTLRYCNVPTTSQRNLDYEVMGPVVPNDVNKPAPKPLNLGILDSEYTLMTPGTTVTPRVQNFNNYAQVDPHYVVMSPACSKSLQQPVFENVRLKSKSSQSHDKKFALDQDTTPKSAEPYFPTALGGTMKIKANEDPMYVNLPSTRTTIDVANHDAAIFGH